jgi:hypothetical protein
MNTSPDTLDAAGIRYRIVPQFVPEIMATLDGPSYYQVINAGPNVAMAVNSRPVLTDGNVQEEYVPCNKACGYRKHRSLPTHVSRLRPLTAGLVDTGFDELPRLIVDPLFAPSGMVTMGQEEAVAARAEERRWAEERRLEGLSGCYTGLRSGFR